MVVIMYCFIGCKDKASAWYSNGFHTYIDHHAGTPNNTETKDTIILDYSSLCYITSRIGWVSMKGIYKL